MSSHITLAPKRNAKKASAHHSSEPLGLRTGFRAPETYNTDAPIDRRLVSANEQLHERQRR